MDQAEFELQLRVWKDLAISKQVLIRTATDALSLAPECSTDDLRAALENAIKRSINADANIAEAREHSTMAISEMERKVAINEKSMAVAESAKGRAEEALVINEKTIATERAAHIVEMKKIKAQLAEKDKEVKAINKALADTPQNVLKKLKTLKKQKDDEATARKVIANEATTLRKEKRAQEQRVSELKAHLEQSSKLVDQHRELHELSVKLHEQLKPLVDAKELAHVPKLDDKTLDAIVEAAKDEKDKKDKKEKKDKK